MKEEDMEKDNNYKFKDIDFDNLILTEEEFEHIENSDKTIDEMVTEELGLNIDNDYEFEEDEIKEEIVSFEEFAGIFSESTKIKSEEEEDISGILDKHIVSKEQADKEEELYEIELSLNNSKLELDNLLTNMKEDEDNKLYSNIDLAKSIKTGTSENKDYQDRLDEFGKFEDLDIRLQEYYKNEATSTRENLILEGWDVLEIEASLLRKMDEVANKKKMYDEKKYGKTIERLQSTEKDTFRGLNDLRDNLRFNVDEEWDKDPGVDVLGNKGEELKVKIEKSYPLMTITMNTELMRDTVLKRIDETIEGDDIPLYVVTGNTVTFLKTCKMNTKLYTSLNRLGVKPTLYKEKGNPLKFDSQIFFDPVIFNPKILVEDIEYEEDQNPVTDLVPSEMYEPNKKEIEVRKIDITTATEQMNEDIKEVNRIVEEENKQEEIKEKVIEDIDITWKGEYNPSEDTIENNNEVIINPEINKEETEKDDLFGVEDIEDIFKTVNRTHTEENINTKIIGGKLEEKILSTKENIQQDDEDSLDELISMNWDSTVNTSE